MTWTCLAHKPPEGCRSLGSLLDCYPDLFKVKEAPAARAGEVTSPEMAVLEVPGLCSSLLASEQSKPRAWVFFPQQLLRHNSGQH